MGITLEPLQKESRLWSIVYVNWTLEGMPPGVGLLTTPVTGEGWKARQQKNRSRDPSKLRWASDEDLMPKSREIVPLWG